MAKTLDELELRALLDPDSAAPRAPSPYTANARYLTSLDGFNIKRPADPRARVPRRARPGPRSRRPPTGLVPLDLSATLGLGYPATTPLILSRYARIRAGDTLSTAFRASAEVYHVIRGSGTTTAGDLARRSPGRRPTPSACPAARRPGTGRRRTPCSGSRPTSPSSSSRRSSRRRRGPRRSSPRSTRWRRSAGGSSRCTWTRAGPPCPASR